VLEAHASLKNQICETKTFSSLSVSGCAVNFRSSLPLITLAMPVAQVTKTESVRVISWAHVSQPTSFGAPVWQRGTS
jgi:hypothetical protein